MVYVSAGRTALTGYSEAMGQVLPSSTTSNAPQLLFGRRPSGTGPDPLVLAPRQLPVGLVADGDLLAQARRLPTISGMPPRWRHLHSSAPLTSDGEIITGYLGIVLLPSPSFVAIIDGSRISTWLMKGASLQECVQAINDELDRRRAQYADPSLGPGNGVLRFTRHGCVQAARQSL
jgi:hypothetical protein